MREFVVKPSYKPCVDVTGGEKIHFNEKTPHEKTGTTNLKYKHEHDTTQNDD